MDNKVEGAEAPSSEDDGPPNFIEERIKEELAQGLLTHPLRTRFPPEPNGYLHIGHAKSICLNFGLAALSEGATVNLRFDDTNPEAEEQEYIDAIKEDIRWLGLRWDRELYASDYFEQLYQWALRMIERGEAYVDSQSLEAIREGRGSFHKPGVDSPYRERSVEESLDLFKRMRAGEFEPGEHVLRAKIDMQSKDLKLRDPLMYRILKVAHHRTGTEWPIYPMYDWAHGQSDAIEGITHSICTLEFQNHRGLYEWFLDHIELPGPRPTQIEFAKLALTYIVLSKRRLKLLVDEGYVSGWDDPRMPTLSGLRRRGVTPSAIRKLADRVGVAKKDGIVDISLFEHILREDLNDTSPRRMAVLRPLKLVLTNYPEGESERFWVPNHPTDESFGRREVPFSRVLYIEQEDFMEVPAKRWFRLAPGREVRLRGACLVRCDEVIKDEAGEVVELRCTWDPDSRGGKAADGRKVKGTLHWVSAEHAVDAEVRLYDRLYTVENPMGHEGKDFTDFLNPASLEVVTGAKLEPSFLELAVGDRVQFERNGYFCLDPDTDGERQVWNRTIALKDSWAKIVQKGA